LWRHKSGENLIVSKITSKAQTTVPRSVRAALKLGVGDTIVYAIEGDHVVMTKATTATAESPTATFDEWSSENDRHAYAGL
jgi:antitoxin PrlF